ncbi:hypothetical protein [Nocardia brasiliensis]|uniref:hypothetical protein n=1 Tax=Nocardia brasiliensis TaxID=37326 RepID=UPI00189460D1|nr:hypothetical protein [Nocardia brasiliensis]MBF6546956.1 hypothetical protein [Nocardia brasiliensis]
MNDPYNPDETADTQPDFIVGVPLGDHPITAEHLANQAIALLTGALAEIADVVGIHQDMAPQSACYVLELAGEVADITIRWMHRWPK